MKKLTQAKLLKKYEQKLKPIILHRDGNKCQLEGYRHGCSPYLCMDHRPAKRGKHSTFFDPRNLTTLCISHNQSAEYDPFISDRVLSIVRSREGKNIIELLEAESRVIKKWHFAEIEEWIEKCRHYFIALGNKSGKP